MIRNFLILLVLIVFCGACKKVCDNTYHIGELVRIPIQFTGFTVNEINNISVYRMHVNDSMDVDTFTVRDILWTQGALNELEYITDRNPVPANDSLYGYYDSYFDSCHLIFEWQTGRDSFMNMQVKKSKGESDECHKDDPNIRIDLQTFIHKGQSVPKGMMVEFVK